MPDIKDLLEKATSQNEKEAWAAVGTLVNMRPTSDEEKRARAYGCCCLAEASFSRGKIGTAIDWWQEAINEDPLNYLYRLAFVARGLMPAGMNLQALNEVERALKLNNKDPDGWRLLGHVHVNLRNSKAAIAAFDKQIELAPDEPVSYLDRIDIALDTGDWETVERLSKFPIGEHGVHKGNALHQLGLMAFRQGKHEEALKIWDDTLAHECDNREVVVWNKSNAQLSLGQYREGWRNHEARRLQSRDSAMAFQSHRGMPDKLFCNEPAPARLHVFQEMGFGDAICMARYLPLLVDGGYDVRFEVMDSLVELMQQSLPGVKVMPRAPIFPGLLGVPQFDYIVPALSLPKLFGTEVSTIPWNGPYLKADPKKVEEYRAKLRGHKAVGLCWSSGVRTDHGMWLEEYGKRKSTTIDEIFPIISALQDYCVVSLQVGAKDSGILDILPDNPTWADTAALVECLDLVITVDTSVAHLAGAMGKPLWLLMHTEGSWHWMAERPGASWNDTSPWYPTARLFRAKQPHKWDDVISEIAQRLKLRAVA